MAEERCAVHSVDTSWGKIKCGVGHTPGIGDHEENVAGTTGIIQERVNHIAVADNTILWALSIGVR